MRIKCSAAELPKLLERQGTGAGRAVARGMMNGAYHGMSILVRRSPVYLGQLKASWRVTTHVAGKYRVPEIENTAPHVGIVEAGARPHPVSREGVEALTRWAHLVLGLDPAESERAARGIAFKIRREGQAPTYFVRDSLPAVGRAMSAGVAAELKRTAGGAR